MNLSGILEHIAPILRQFDASFLDHIDIIAAHTTPLSFKAGERFPKEGREHDQAAYVLEGVFRVYTVDNSGKEKIIRLPAEGDFTMYLENYMELSDAVEYRWEAITDGIVLSWGKDDLEFLVTNIPHWHFLTLKIMQTLILHLYIERGEMFNDDATTRYIKFAERHPDIITRVPLRYIANYLGIAPQSLSRIRQHLAKTAI